MKFFLPEEVKAMLQATRYLQDVFDNAGFNLDRGIPNPGVKFMGKSNKSFSQVSRSNKRKSKIKAKYKLR